MLRTPYLPGSSDMDQLKTIFRALGTPTEEEWPVRPFDTRTLTLCVDTSCRPGTHKAAGLCSRRTIS
jgi:hypothetical protein